MDEAGDREPRGERGRGLADRRAARCLRAGRRAEQGGDLGRRVDVGRDVDPARVTVIAEVGRGDREADKRGAVDLRCERQRVQDADDGEPPAAEEDAGGVPPSVAKPREAAAW